MSEQKWDFTVFFSGEGESKTTPKEAKRNSASLDNKTASLSKEEVRRGVLAVETLTGLRSGGKEGGYHERYVDPEGKNQPAYGAYQIRPDIWDKQIKEKYGWDLSDWYSPKKEDNKLMAQRQDRIAEELLFPSWKKSVANLHLYETPLGQHLPKGSLEILAQLGPYNLKKFLETGYDKTAIKSKPDGQIIPYLKGAFRAIGKEIPSSFSKKLKEMGGPRTKYNTDINLAEK